MNQQIIAAARRHIADVEVRIAEQWSHLDHLVAADREASETIRTLRQLQQTLLLSKEHIRFMLRHEEG